MRIVVVGASAAGISAITALRRLDKKVEIVLVSKDVNIYSRCILHHYVKGVRTIEKLSFVNPNFINNMDVIWKKGLSVTKVDPKRKKITLSNGEIVGYDRLLLATGASTFYPPIPGLREARNANAHPEDRSFSFKADDLRRWSKEVFDLEGEIK